MFRGGLHRVAVSKGYFDEPVAVKFPDSGDVPIFDHHSVGIERVYLEWGRPRSLQFRVDLGDLLDLTVG